MKAEIKKKYDELVASLDNTKMYDGRGEYNGYVCEECGYITATLYIDKGVTPFSIKCQRCGGVATHKITSRSEPKASQNISEVRKWVRPTFEQLVNMSPSTINHVLNGGLVFEDILK